MQIPPFLLDEWLNHYHFASTPPELDLASSTGLITRTSELLELMTPDERERFNETQLIYSAVADKRSLRQAIGDLHGVGVDEVQILTGASEALLWPTKDRGSFDQPGGQRSCDDERICLAGK